jgi:hypothetical protein
MKKGKLPFPHKSPGPSSSISTSNLHIIIDSMQAWIIQSPSKALEIGPHLKVPDGFLP